jgi:hypothetical protein
MIVPTSHRKKHWLRLSLAVSAVVLVVAVVGIESLHFRTWHHPVWFGVHTHILRESADIGIPGISNDYAVTASNCTLFPIQMRGCKEPRDTSPYYEILYRYQVEKWEPASGTWAQIMVVPPSCPSEELVTTTLRPGNTMQVVEWEATGARDGFHKGDLARFSVFTSFNDGDDVPGQRLITSPAFIIEDEKLESDIPYRVRH